MSDVVINTASVPQNFCPSNIQQDWPKLVALLSGTVQSTDKLLIQSATPGADDFDKAWLRLESSGLPIRLYTYSNGLWLSLNTALSGDIKIYLGDEAQIPFHDEGDGPAVAVTAFTGPMWEKAAVLNARIPMGAGTLDSGKVLAVGESYGTEKVTLSSTNMPMHAHDIKASTTGTITGGDGGWVIGVGATRARDLPDSPQIRTGVTEWFGTDSPDNFSVVPPVYGVFFIQRTLRRFYRV